MRAASIRLGIALCVALASPGTAEAGELEGGACVSPPPRSGSGVSTSITFHNDTARPVRLSWVDGDGALKDYGSLAAGATRKQATYASHVWVASNDAGTCLAQYTATASAATAHIGERPSPPPIKPAPTPSPADDPEVTTPPPSLKLDPFYARYVDAGGLAVLSSPKVDPAVLRRARSLIMHMLQSQPEILQRLGQRGFHLAIIAESEVTTDIPEHRDLNEAFPDTDWNTRTRGVGATVARPATSAGAENVMCRESDRYRGESILLHEFAHTILLHGIEPFDPAFGRRVDQAYARAMANGLWSNTYAAVDRNEYWAEGVQSWFNANASATPPDGIHGDIDTRAELQAYDSELAGLVAEVFGTGTWRYRCPAAP